ncbi:MAG: M28 family peptidase [Clostridia bacterium]|nr:M28 family peptidase [Clostridia bacterium]
MRAVQDLLNEINDRFPVRNSDEQKAAFRAWAAERARKAGHTVREENNEDHVNLVIGDPDRAEVIFTAHCDTPRRSFQPNLMLPVCAPLRYAYMFANVVPMLAVSIFGGWLAQRALGEDASRFVRRIVMLGVYTALYLGLFFLLFRGPANRHNKNDNTSGTAAVLTLAERLPAGGKAAWILFDDEEKGKKGSKAFAAAHPEIKTGTLVVNMDCVGNGTRFLASVANGARSDPAFAALEKALAGIDTLVYPAAKASMNSDQRNFDRGVGLCACLPSRLAKWYVPRIHTVRDTVASWENIDTLAAALEGFVRET